MWDFSNANYGFIQPIFNNICSGAFKKCVPSLILEKAVL